MTDLPEIASLWIGGRLSFLEQLCLKSYLDNGHEVTLYSYETIEGVPKGIKVKDASELYPGPPFRVHLKRQSPAIHAYYFRLKMLKRGNGEIWADTDAYCLRPFRFDNPHVFASMKNNVDYQIPNGVLRLPPESLALAAYDEFLEAEQPNPPFFPPYFQNTINQLAKSSFVIPIEGMPWGTSGPLALTYFLKVTGEDEHALPEHVFYPNNFTKHKKRFLRPRADWDSLIQDDTVSLHFYGRIVRDILRADFGGLPKPDSILEVLCREHGINPKDAPIG